MPPRRTLFPTRRSSDLTGSGALLAETAHSIADSVNQILLYVGIRRSVRPASERHPLGHGKERYFWALIVALFLFFGGGVFSMRSEEHTSELQSRFDLVCHHVVRSFLHDALPI